MIKVPGVGEVRPSAMIALGVKLVAVLVAFVASILYARVLGPGGFGTFAIVLAWAAVLGTLSGLGYPQFILRDGSKSQFHAASILRDAYRRIAAGGVVPAALLIAFAWYQDEPVLRACFLLAVPLPLLTAIAGAQQSAIQSRGQIVAAIAPNTLGGPIFTLGIFLIFFAVSDQLQATDLMLSYVISTVLVATIYVMSVRRWVRPASDITSANENSGWTSPGLGVVLPFMILAGAYLLLGRLDLVMLGLLSTAPEAGSYAVAARAAELPVFVGMALVGFLAPRFAALHHEGKKAELQRLLTALGRALLILTVPPALFMYVFAEDLLGLLYGEPFSVAYSVLRVLIVAQLFVVLGGPLGTLLNMTGFEREHLIVMALALFTNIGLNVVLIPKLGALGAALSTLVMLIASRLALSVIVRSRLGLRPGSFGV